MDQILKEDDELMKLKIKMMKKGVEMKYDEWTKFRLNMMK